jgi:hypothetical protein
MRTSALRVPFLMNESRLSNDDDDDDESGFTNIRK